MLKVRDLMTEDVISLTPADSLQALYDVMMTRNVRHVPIVTDEGEVLAVVSHRDLVAAINAEVGDLTLATRQDLLEDVVIRDIMRDGVETTEPEQDIAAAGQTMLEGKLGCLPVVEGDRLIGIITESDFVRYVCETA